MEQDKKILNYKSFFGDQIKEAIDDQQKINRSEMRQLFKTDELSLAYVDRIQYETGMVILKFPRRRTSAKIQTITLLAQILHLCIMCQGKMMDMTMLLVLA